MVWSGQAGFGEQELKEWEVGGSPAGKMRAYGGLTFASVYGGSHMVCVMCYVLCVMFYVLCFRRGRHDHTLGTFFSCLSLCVSAVCVVG